jgi:hypothetical protein
MYLSLSFVVISQANMVERSLSKVSVAWCMSVATDVSDCVQG